MSLMVCRTARFQLEPTAVNQTVHFSMGPISENGFFVSEQSGPKSKGAVTTAIRFRFDGRSTAYVECHKDHSDVTHISGR